MAENRFKAAAAQALGGSKVIQGRTKVSTEDLIAKYPKGVTVTEFDVIVKGDGDTYPVFAFAEDEKLYFNGGSLAAKVANEWVSMFDGDIEGASEALKACGGVRFVLGTKKTKTGKNITTFDPVD